VTASSLQHIVGLTFGLATKAVSQADTQRSHAEWRQYNGGYDATRFSSLTQINTNNVGSLREVARFKIPETMSFQSEPVVVEACGKAPGAAVQRREPSDDGGWTAH